jgi:predicted O-methyltransferase YrrM
MLSIIINQLQKSKNKFIKNNFAHPLGLIDHTDDIDKFNLYTLKKKFIFDQIKRIFQKKYLIHKKNEFKKIMCHKKIIDEESFFSIESLIFIKDILKIKLSKEKISILEIGSFEGMSTNYFLKNFPNSELDAVDPFMDYDEDQMKKFLDSKKYTMSLVEQNFIYNVKEYLQCKRIRFFKNTSDDFFKKKCDKKYDLIYIDGLHIADQVLRDGKNAWKVLKKNGIIIFDDYNWYDSNKEAKKNPNYVINHFYNHFIKEIFLLVVNSNFVIQKI